MEAGKGKAEWCENEFPDWRSERSMFFSLPTNEGTVAKSEGTSFWRFWLFGGVDESGFGERGSGVGGSPVQGM